MIATEKEHLEFNIVTNSVTDDLKRAIRMR